MQPDSPPPPLPYGQADVRFHQAIGVAMLPATAWGAFGSGGSRALLVAVAPLGALLLAYFAFRMFRRWPGRGRRAAEGQQDRRVFLRVLVPAMALYWVLKPYALRHFTRTMVDSMLLVGIGVVAVAAALVPWARASFYRRVSSIIGGATLIACGLLLPLLPGQERITILGLFLMTAVLVHAGFMQHLLNRQRATTAHSPTPLADQGRATAEFP